MAAASLTPLLNALYVSGKEGETILRKLTRAGGFTADNVVSRLAIARSLAEGPSTGDLAMYGEATGKQIKGFTLLGRRETASALIAMMIEAEGKPQREAGLKSLIRYHWERGLRLIDTELSEGDLATLLLSYAQTATLADAPSVARGSRVAVSSIDVSVVGQTALRRRLRRLLANAAATEPPHLRKPFVLIAPHGAGRRHVAHAIASTLQLPFVEVRAGDVDDALLLSAIDEQLAAQGYGVIMEGQTTVVPPAIVYVADADMLPDEGLIPLLDLLGSPRRKRNARVAIAGGGLVLSATSSLRWIKAEPLEFAPYTRDEVAEITKRVLGGLPQEIRRYLALAGRFNPEAALDRGIEFLGWVRDAKKSPSEGLLLELMEKGWGLDRLGLRTEDYQLLAQLKRAPAAELEPGDASFLERLHLVRNRDSKWHLTPRGEEALRIREGDRP